MSALKNVTQGFRNLWGAADDDYDETHEESHERETDTQAASDSYRDSSRDPDHSRSQRHSERSSERYEKFTAPTDSGYSEPSYGGGGSGSRRLRPVAMPLRASREKNIYTLKPKSLDESSVAADYLKTGCAVVINLEEVEQGTAIRIIDFMSGVCYGLESQGHAMKLGEKIFLFTPGDFEISSDEIDYAENRDLIFKDVTASPAPALSSAPTASPSNSNNSERRSWER